MKLTLVQFIGIFLLYTEQRVVLSLLFGVAFLLIHVTLKIAFEGPKGDYVVILLDI